MHTHHPSSVYAPFTTPTSFRKVKFDRQVRPLPRNRFQTVREDYAGYSFRVPESALPDVLWVVCRGSKVDDFGVVSPSNTWVVHHLETGYPMPRMATHETREKAVRFWARSLMRMTVTARDLVHISGQVRLESIIHDLAGRATTHYRPFAMPAALDIDLPQDHPAVARVASGDLMMPTLSAGELVHAPEKNTITLPRGQRWLQSYIDFKRREAAIRALESS